MIKMKGRHIYHRLRDKPKIFGGCPFRPLQASIGIMRRGKIAWDRWALAGVILFILALILVAGANRVRRRPVSSVSKVSLGSDQVFCTRDATPQDALLLGEALRGTGYFHNSGASVLLSKHGSVKQISFALEDGAWDHPATIAAFEEIGRRVATSIGGFPIQVDLADSKFAAHRSLKVGKVLSGAHDVVYYFGSATENDAVSLALALTDARYLGGDGATIALWKDGETAIGFVVGDGVWNRTDAVAGFVQLTRKTAGAVGGLPVHLRLLSSQMDTRKEVAVE